VADTGRATLPIVDPERRLVGIVTQSDLIAALYGSGIAEALHLDVLDKARS